jgi:hypothetical protein
MLNRLFSATAFTPATASRALHAGRLACVESRHAVLNGGILRRCASDMLFARFSSDVRGTSGPMRFLLLGGATTFFFSARASAAGSIRALAVRAVSAGIRP